MLFKKRSFAALAIFAVLLVGCDPSSNKPELQEFEEDGFSVAYTERVPVDVAKKFHGFLNSLRERSLDMTGKAMWLDRGERYRVVIQVKPGTENDPKAIKSFSVVGRLIGRHVFDFQQIEYQLCDEDFETLRVLSLDPLDDLQPESHFSADSSTPQGACTMLMDAVRSGTGQSVDSTG